MDENRRQEAIEIITKYLITARRRGYREDSCDCKLEAEALYDRLAPLFEREFPETAMMGLIAQCRGRKANLDDIVCEFKRLWHGQEAGVCQACGEITVCVDRKTGRHSIRNKGGDLFWTGPRKNGWIMELRAKPGEIWDAETESEARLVFTENCPDCTGERRKGERRVEEPQFMVDTRMVYIGYSREYGMPLYTEDRRISEERRK